MPKKSLKNLLHLDLLKPQSNPEKSFVKLSRWLLSTGRYIIIFVELLVLVAFISRFKFDADIAETKEAIEQQIPFIESQKNDEDLIKQTQLKLTTIKDLRKNDPNYANTLQKISNQIPQNIKLILINIEKQPGKLNFKISGTAQNNNDLNTLVLGLKSDPLFQEINLDSISLEQGTITFSVSGSTPTNSKGEKET